MKEAAVKPVSSGETKLPLPVLKGKNYIKTQ